jgi:alkylhydroperoxidase family enzyme
MRRRLARYLPIVALALLVQLLAPIGAFRVVAQAASDPLAMAARCSGMPAAETAPAMPAGVPAADGNCCAVCAMGLGSPPVPGTTPQALDLPRRQFQRVVWQKAITEPPVARVGSNAQARAPPILT